VHRRVERVIVALHRCIGRIVAETGALGRDDGIDPVAREIEPQAVVGRHGPHTGRPECALARLRFDGSMGAARCPIARGRHQQRRIDALQSRRDSRRFRLVDEIRLCNGHNSLQVDFQQVRIADIKAAIRRIDIDDRFIARGVVDPGEGMRWHGRAC
jgi:hypothetical protein